MKAAKIAVSVDPATLAELDRLVASRVFSSRSQAVQIAVQEKLARLAKTRLLQECAKLDPREEQALAELGIAGDAAQWPPY
jgi:metal-responsive CopG/Arc/MetJ family transcriptional regulator